MARQSLQLHPTKAIRSRRFLALGGDLKEMARDEGPLRAYADSQLVPAPKMKVAMPKAQAVASNQDKCADTGMQSKAVSQSNDKKA